jgi:hypothetical protein
MDKKIEDKAFDECVENVKWQGEKRVGDAGALLAIGGVAMVTGFPEAGLPALGLAWWERHKGFERQNHPERYCR